MKIRCLHGYFLFDELYPGELSKFMELTQFQIEASENHFTFSSLADAPRYSIVGGEYLGALATKTFEGEPWEVMRENGLVYDFLQDEVVPILTITNAMTLKQTNNYFIANGMILPGSITDDGSRVKDYAAFYSFTKSKYVYSEVISE